MQLFDSEILFHADYLQLIPSWLSIEIQQSLRLQIDKLSNEIISCEELKQISLKLYSSDIVEIHYALVKLRKLTCNQELIKNSLIIQLNLDCGVVKNIFWLLKQWQQIPLLIYEAVWVLLNLTYRSASLIDIQNEADGVKLLNQLLQYSNELIVNLTVLTIENLAAHCWKIRDLLIENGIFYTIVKLTQQQLILHTSQTLSNYICCFSQLCRGSPPPRSQEIEKTFSLIFLLIDSNIDVDDLKNVLLALSNISYSQHNIQQIIDTGVVPCLIQLLSHDNIKIILTTLRGLENFMEGDEEQISYIFQLFFLETLQQLLQHQAKEIRKQVCLCLQRLIKGCNGAHQVIKNEAMIQELFKLVKLRDDEEVLCEVAGTFTKMTKFARPCDMDSLVSFGLIQFLVDLLQLQNAELLIHTLQGIIYVLQVGKLLCAERKWKNCYMIIFMNTKAVPRIYQLKMHKDQIIVRKVQELSEIIEL